MKSFICKICDEEFETTRQLFGHIKRIHKTTTKDYYDNYMLSEKKERFCELCGTEKQFRNTKYGYNRTCYNCEETLTQQEYYDKYMLVNASEKLCKVCGKETKFVKKSYGYLEFCSDDCRYSEKGVSITREKCKDTLMREYGVESILLHPEFMEKFKQTCIDNNGVEFPFQSEKIRNKSVDTLLTNYDVDNSMKIESVKQKVKETCKHVYGCENPMQNDIVKEKFKTTCQEKFKAPSPLESPIILEKIKKTNQEKRNCDYVTQDKEIMDKIQNSRKESYWVTYLEKLLEKEIKPLHTKEEYVRRELDVFTYECLRCGYIIESESSITQRVYCPNHTSREEEDLCNLIEKSYKVLKNNKYNLGKSREIDILIPSLNIGFEYNGIYWHSVKQKPTEYHLDKKRRFKEYEDIDVIHIYPTNTINKSNLEKFINTITTIHEINNPTISEIEYIEYLENFNNISISENIKTYDSYFKVVENSRVICVFGINGDSIDGLVYEKMNPKLVYHIFETTRVNKMVLDYDTYLERHFVFENIITENLEPDLVIYDNSGYKLISDVDNYDKKIQKLYNSGKIIIKLKNQHIT